jgi:hypothetical protein
MDEEEMMREIKSALTSTVRPKKALFDWVCDIEFIGQSPFYLW